MKIERKKNAIRNTKWGVLQKVINLILPFLVRTVLIYALSAEYSGLSSLFTSILQVLSLTELGFSNAIVYSMYKPIAEDDTDAICALLNLYRKAYNIIGTVILVLGLALVPFLPHLINGDVPDGINLYLLYFIYLFNTVISYYLFAYKTCLLTAYQREDKLSKNSLIYNLFCYITQCVVLIVFRNYYVFAIILPVSTIILNILNNNSVKKLFPNIIPKGNVSEEKKKTLKKDIIGLLIWKIGGMTRNTFDSVVVSFYLGLTVVTIYNNYFFIISGVNTILGVICSSISAGVGNKIAVESSETNYSDFQRFHFCYMWIAGLCCICLMCLFQPFMKFWMGEELMFDNTTMFMFCYYFIMMKQGDINSVYYQAAGLWWHGKYRSIIEAFINLSLNILLGKFFGVKGIILATIISFSCIYFYGSRIVFVNYFKNKKDILFFGENILFLVLTFGTGFLTYLCGDYIVDKLVLSNSVLIMAVKLVACFIIPNIVFFSCYSLNKRYRGYIKGVFSLILRKV